MLDETTLRDLLHQAIADDQQACAELVRHLEPVIRRAVRVHFPPTDPLRRLFDSMDISQSVLIRFLTKAGMGSIQWQSPGKLQKLLRRMAVQKFIDKKRAAQAQRRDYRHIVAESCTLASTSRTSLEDMIVNRELYHQVCQRLTERELVAAELWSSGHSFPEIARQIGHSRGKPMQPNAIRMMLQRALIRVGRQFPGD